MTVEEVVSDLVHALGGRLRAAVLYGPHASGSAGRFDEVRLLLVLASADPETLALAGPALKRGLRSARIRPYLLAEGELARLSDAFPVKVTEMLRARRVLHGEDPLDGVRVDPDHLRLRLEQLLRNHLIRLRSTLALRADEPAARMTAMRLGAELLEVEASVVAELAPHAAMPAAIAEALRAVRAGDDHSDALPDLVGWLERAISAVDAL